MVYLGFTCLLQQFIVGYFSGRFRLRDSQGCGWEECSTLVMTLVRLRDQVGRPFVWQSLQAGCKVGYVPRLML